MEITVIKERDRTTCKIMFAGKTAGELLREIKVNVETVLVVRNNEVITEDVLLEDKDILELLSVVSGG